VRAPTGALGVLGPCNSGDLSVPGGLAPGESLFSEDAESSEIALQSNKNRRWSSIAGYRISPVRLGHGYLGFH
jgi:hypothetical protein